MPKKSQSNKPASESSNLQVASRPQIGTDPVAQSLISAGLPVTRENYLRRAGWEEPLGAELEATLPAELSTFPKE